MERAALIERPPGGDRCTGRLGEPFYLAAEADRRRVGQGPAEGGPAS